jgi:hypothetical protein
MLPGSRDIPEVGPAVAAPGAGHGVIAAVDEARRARCPRRPRWAGRRRVDVEATSPWSARSWPHLERRRGKGGHVVVHRTPRVLDVGANRDAAGAVRGHVAVGVHRGDRRVGRAPRELGARPLAAVGVQRARAVAHAGARVEAFARARFDVDPGDGRPGHHDLGPHLWRRTRVVGGNDQRRHDRRGAALGARDETVPDLDTASEDAHLHAFDRVARGVQGLDTEGNALTQSDGDLGGHGPERGHAPGGVRSRVLGREGGGGHEPDQGQARQ